MKINPNMISKAIGVYKSQKSKEARMDGKEDSKTDQLSLSKDAQAFQIGLKAAHASPDVRMAKVEEIKARMEAGQYRVSSYDIASKIVDDILSNK